MLQIEIWIFFLYDLCFLFCFYRKIRKRKVKATLFYALAYPFTQYTNYFEKQNLKYRIIQHFVHFCSTKCVVQNTVSVFIACWLNRNVYKSRSCLYTFCIFHHTCFHGNFQESFQWLTIIYNVSKIQVCCKDTKKRHDKIYL